MKKINLTVVFILLFCSLFAQKKKLIIPEQPLEQNRIKSGWQLIFEDNFDTPFLDANKWNKSDKYDDYVLETFRSILPNPANVQQQNGNLVLRIDTTNYLEAKNSGSEIKTYSNLDKSFSGYSFGENSLLEIKVKTSFDKGLGYAVWLFSDDQSLPYSEIDIFETHATKIRRNEFNTSYHWNNKAGTKRATEDISIRLYQSKKKKLNVDAQWLTFKCAWAKDSILCWVNDVLCFSIATKNQPKKIKNQSVFYPPINSMKLRITAWCSVVGKREKMDDNFAKTQMLVDYVRVYRKETFPPLKEVWSFNEINKNESKSILYEYIAGVKYEWIAPDFEINKSNIEWHINEGCKIFKAKSHCEKGKFYPIQLKTTFPDGKSKTSYWNIKII